MPASTDPSRKVRLSVAMIVRNEQAVLAESLRSVRAIADEIVVLDTGSTDGTLALAEKAGARCLRANWTDDFASARNLLLRQVSGDWILWLDAGETMDEPSAAELRSWLDRHAQPGNAYMLLVRSPSPSPGGSAEQVAQPRLMPRSPDLRFEGRIRETIEPSVRGLGMAFEAAPGVIRRHARHHDPAVKVRRARRDLRIAELELESTPHPRPRTLTAKGEALTDLGQPREAKEAFWAAIRAAEPGSTAMLEAYYGLLTAEDADPSQLVQQISICLEALEVYPLDAQLHLAMGNYLQNRGELNLAARSFRAAMEHGQVNLEVWHLTEVAEVAASCLSLILQLQNQDDEAVQLLEQARKRFTNSPRLSRREIDLHIKHGRADQAIAAATGLGLTAPQHRALADAIRGACKAAAKEWTPALGYLQAAYLAGCEDPICLRWLTITFLSNGRREEVRDVLRKWIEREPGNAEALAYRDALDRPEPQGVDWVDTQPTGAAWLRIDAAGPMDVCPPHWPEVIQLTTHDDLLESTASRPKRP